VKSDLKPKYSVWQNVCYVVKGAWRADKKVFAYFGIFSVLSGAMPIINLVFPRFILQELMEGKQLKRLIATLIAFFLIGAIVGYGKAYLNQAYFPRLVFIRFEFMKKHNLKCMETDYKNTENPDFLNDKETAFRCLDNNNNGIEGMMHRLYFLGGNLLAIFGYITIISMLNGYVLLYLTINMLISYYFTYRVRKYEHEKKDEISENDRRSSYIYNLMYDFAYGKELRIYGLSEWIAGLFQQYKDRRLTTHKKIKWKGFRAGMIDVLLLVLREGIIYTYLIYLVLKGRLSIPDLTMYFGAIASFAEWFNKIINDLAHIRAQNLDINDFRKFVEHPEEEEGERLKLPEGPYEIEFRNVAFHYPNSETYIYKNLNLTIPFGQKLAIVGHNGAGKTTFVKLLCRLYEVTEGEILLNGININRFDKEEYAKLFSAVFQEVKILAFSAGENIALTEKDKIDLDRMRLAMEQAGIAEKISSLPHGADTSLLKFLDDEGVELSGGENQKISIARALYKNGPIMVLDEPTAALDALAEYNTYLNFNKMVENKTAIYISHRLASTVFCDTIAMFEQGEIVEYGSHEELLAKKGKYFDMFETQAKYYRQEEDVA
jgi:ABC-type multidrug transport system fused ATPase/permease subunit